MDVRDQILEAATRLFAAQGLAGTSLQEVADAVGVRKPSLLYHFDSKDTLHRAVLDGLLARWNEALPQLLRAAAREDRFDAILDAAIGFFSEDPDRARLLLREALDRPAEMRALLAEYVSPWMGMIAETLRKGQEAGVIRADVDPEAYCVMVIHLIIGNVATAGTVSALASPGARGAKPGPRIIKEIKRFARAALEPDAAKSSGRKGQSGASESRQRG